MQKSEAKKNEKKSWEKQKFAVAIENVLEGTLMLIAHLIRFFRISSMYDHMLVHAVVQYPSIRWTPPYSWKWKHRIVTLVETDIT